MILLIFPIVACKKNEEPTSRKQVRVSTTKAYEKYFGPAPTTDTGTCFAFVIYFPSAKSPGKVVPFPFFTFDEESMKKVAIARLLAGMDVPAFRGEILQPVRPGTRLLGLTEKKGTVTVDFSRELSSLRDDAAGERVFLNAMVLTISQFKGVGEVRVSVAGMASGISLAHGGLARQPLAKDESVVLEPGPPRLLEVAGLKDKGAKNIEDVHVYFDRPVDVKDLSLADKNGKQFARELYRSVFDMAAVLKPKDPSRFTTGMPVKVRWKVVDKKDRSSDGEVALTLAIKEH